MLSRAAATLAVLVATTTLSWPLATARASDPAGGNTCGLNWNESEYGSQYLDPITGRKNISCEDAQTVANAALKAKPNLYCAAKTHYRKWTIRHAGRYKESLDARFTKGKQQFRIGSQGSCT